MQHASTLAEEALAAVLRDDKGRYVFIAADGDAYVSSDPLGSLQRVKPPRSEPIGSITTGPAAVLGVSGSGLVRSTDYGASWQPVAYAKDKPFGKAVSVALDTHGNGVLVHLPQRLFVTHDDGATWAPVASPPNGAYEALRDGADRIFVVGYRDLRATLDGNQLTATSDAPAAIVAGAAPPRLRDFSRALTTRSRIPIPVEAMVDLERSEPLHVLAGDRVVDLDLDADKKVVTTRSGPLGGALSAPTAQEDLGTAAPDARLVAAYGGEIVYARVDADAATTTLVRSKDHGATWKKEDVLQGVPGGALSVAVGPGGWTYVGPLCADRYERDCKPAKVRPAGKTAFQDSEGLGSDVRSVSFDEARSKVYALVVHGGTTVVYEGRLDDMKVTPTDVLPPGSAPIGMAVSDDGTLSVFERTPEQRWVLLRKRTAKGDVLPVRYLKLPLESDTFAFAGSRGLLIGNHDSYETSDAGETWVRVPSNGATRDLQCSSAGCLLPGAQRVGWDLPAAASNEVVRAATTEPEHGSTKPPPAQAPRILTCQAAGKASPVDDAELTWVDGTGPIRWARLNHDYVSNRGIMVTWADKTIHHATLLGPEQPVAGTDMRTVTDGNDDGFVAARYRYVPRSINNKLNPVHVELAWWSPGNGQVHHAVLPSVKPFRVSRLSLGGKARVVDGGILFQGEQDDVVHFAHDNGTTETLTAPGLSFDAAWHSGKQWVLVSTDNDVVELASSDDGGKKWSLRGWGMGPMNPFSEGLLETIAPGKPVLRGPGGLYALALPLAADPPAPLLLDESNVDGPCDGLVVGSASRRESSGATTPVKTADGLITAYRVLHDTAAGKRCTSVYMLEGDGNREAYLYPEKSGWTGWGYRQTDDKSAMEPLTCK